MALNISITESFKNAFENRCFTLMINAYKTSLTLKEIQLNWDENDISAQLHEYVHNDPLRIKWNIASNVESHIFQNTVKKTKGFASKFPRIDFRFSTFSSSSEWVYYFEAKNLKQGDSALKRRYIRTGIDNFVAKKYSNGSIIGYLLKGEINETVEGINSLLKKDKRNPEILNQQSHDHHSFYYESIHSEIGILKHFIFNFSTFS